MLTDNSKSGVLVAIQNPVFRLVINFAKST